MVIIAIAAVKGATTAYRRYRREESRSALILPLCDRGGANGGVFADEDNFWEVQNAQSTDGSVSLSTPVLQSEASLPPVVDGVELPHSAVDTDLSNDGNESSRAGEEHASQREKNPVSNNKSTSSSRIQDKRPQTDDGSYNHARRSRSAPLSDELSKSSPSAVKLHVASSSSAPASTATHVAPNTALGGQSSESHEPGHRVGVYSTSTTQSHAAKNAWTSAAKKASAVAAISNPKPPLPVRHTPKNPTSDNVAQSLGSLTNEKAQTDMGSSESSLSPAPLIAAPKSASCDIGSFNHAMRSRTANIPSVRAGGASRRQESHRHARGLRTDTEEATASLPSRASLSSANSETSGPLRKTKTMPAVPSPKPPSHDPGSFNAVLASSSSSRITAMGTGHEASTR